MKLSMRRAARIAVNAALAFAACTAHAFDRSQCKQYGGPNDCWTPIISEWAYTVCAETKLTPYSVAWCLAQGGTSAYPACNGLPPPEYRRPHSEADIQPFALDIFTHWEGPLCEGPTADPYSWDAVWYSANCWEQVNGPSYTQGYESVNTTSPFPVHGKKQTTSCSTVETSRTFSSRRTRIVSCNYVNYAGGTNFHWTSGASPALCRPGSNLPINPKQPCDGCKSVHKGNPIDINSGVKRQVDVDYAGSGPFPLRFERVYNSRIYTRDGRQWRHNYSAHIENEDFGTTPVAAAHRPSGQLLLFSSVAGVYTPDADINDRITKLVDATDEAFKWALFDRDPLPTWSRGAVTLLGDACHPMRPYLAQGAAMAIEDAWVLSRMLERWEDEPATGIAEYERYRRPRTARVQLRSRDQGKEFHLSARRDVLRRNFKLALASRYLPEIAMRQFDWLHGYDCVRGFE
jgi:hypothetical protein